MLCPYGRSVAYDGNEYKNFQYSPLECQLVRSERKAIVGRKHRAIPCHPPFLHVGKGKRHIFIDNLNLWIEQKKLSGKVQGKSNI